MASHRGIHDASATARMDAARAARNDRAFEVTYLLSILTQGHPGWREAHLVASDTDDWFVVCVHKVGERLSWRISPDDARRYFRHLELQECHRGLPRAAKMAVLCELAEGNKP